MHQAGWELFLLLSVLILGVGPALYELARQQRIALSVLDGFVLVSVGSLVLLHVLPRSISEAGFLALLVALLGLIGPYAAERLGDRVSRGGHLILTILISFGLLPHAALDGMMLIPHGGSLGLESSTALSLAIVIHRLPAGFAVWLLLKPSYGRRWATAVLALMGVATILGAVFEGTYLAGLGSNKAFALLEALVGGSLLHILLHRPQAAWAEARWSGWRLPETIGACLGMVFLLFLPESSSHSLGLPLTSGHYGESLRGIALQTAPALLFGYVLAGVLAVYLPRKSLAWLRRGRSFSQSWRGMAYGLPLPVCSCGVVPIYRSLIVRGAPTTAAMAFLIATPELGVESLLISWPLLGGQLTLARIGCAMSVAVLVGWFVGRSVGAQAVMQSELQVSTEGRGWRRLGRVGEVVRVGLGEVVDETAPWIVAGLAAAAALEPAAIAKWVAGFPAGWDVVLFALVGMPLYVCASGATPLAAVLVAGGISPGAAIAFLLTGPATNVTTFGILSRLHGRWTALKFGGGVMLLSIALGYAVNRLPHPTLSAIGHAHAEPGWFSWLCLSLLTVAFLLSLLRLGPRLFVQSLFSTEALEADHAHGHVPAGEPAGVTVR